MRDPIAEFMNFNRPFAQRNPDLLRLKVARMAESPFAFLRGTFHLYARDVCDKYYEAVPLVFAGAAEIDLVGDIHSENYGTYKADDGVVHYDINDFDETTRGRAAFDVCRLATSLFLAAQERGARLDKAVLVPLACVSAYAESLPRLLKKGYRVDSTGSVDCRPVDDLLGTAAAVKRPEFIDHLTEPSQGQRQLRRSDRYFNLPGNERDQALRLLDDYRRRMPTPPTPDFYEALDVCGRVAGIGSMGRLRYVVLLAGKGKKDARNVLIEFKEARPSAYDVYRQRDTDAAALVSRAERVITVQRLSQIASSPYLGFAVDAPLSFQAREVGPHDSRVDFKTLTHASDWECLAQVQARLLARAHARSVARAVGPVNPLADLQEPDLFCQRVLAFVLAYADLVRRDWIRFTGARAELEKCEEWAKSA
jgi:uncharacterized protein (DUF2252 family)